MHRPIDPAQAPAQAHGETDATFRETTYALKLQQRSGPKRDGWALDFSHRRDGALCRPRSRMHPDMSRHRGAMSLPVGDVNFLSSLLRLFAAALFEFIVSFRGKSFRGNSFSCITH